MKRDMKMNIWNEQTTSESRRKFGKESLPYRNAGDNKILPNQKMGQKEAGGLKNQPHSLTKVPSSMS
jgi:hypothetical protein